MTKYKSKIQSDGSCPFCFSIHEKSRFVPPEVPDNPDIILIGEAPSKDEIQYRTTEFPNGRPFVGASGQVLRKIIKSLNIHPIIINASNCFSLEKPTTDVINRTREGYLLPLLNQYPTLPVVALGAYAAQLIVGGKHGETSLAGEARYLYRRTVVFTYHPAYFLYEHDDRILTEIETSIRAALRPYQKPKYITGILPKDVETVIIDVETTKASYPWYDSKLLLVGIMPIGKPAYILRPEEITDEYKTFLKNNVRNVVGHNLLFDLVHLSFQGIRLSKARTHDTLIYRKNLFPNEWSYGLKDLARRYLPLPAWQAWFHTQLAEQRDLCTVDFNKLSAYNAYDLYATEQLYLQQTKKYNPFLLEMDYMSYILQMTMNGMCVDTNSLNDLGRRTTEKLLEIESNIRSCYGLGSDFNFRSPAQLKIWFNKLGIQLPDTKEETLNEHKLEHPVFRDLLEVRDLAKLGGTSINGLQKYIDEKSLVHSTVSVHGAETGRSASSRPNLQNTDPRVRSNYMSRYGDRGKLLYSDLSSLEYRLIAHASGENKLIQIFNKDEDIHKSAYREIFKRDATSEVERKLGKTANYAGVYECGIWKFINLTGLPESEARIIFERLKNLYPKVNFWKREVIYQLRATGVVFNLFGRSRYFPGKITPEIEREAINWIIQSSGHDVLKIYLMESMDILSSRFPKEVCPLLINESHDSFTLDSKLEVVEEAYKIITDVSNKLNSLINEIFGVKLKVPITAKVKILEVWE